MSQNFSCTLNERLSLPRFVILSNIAVTEILESVLLKSILQVKLLKPTGQHIIQINNTFDPVTILHGIKLHVVAESIEISMLELGYLLLIMVLIYFYGC